MENENVTDVPPATPEQSHSPSSTSTKYSKLFIVLIGILLVLIIGIGVYFLSANNAAKRVAQDNVEQPTPSASVETTISPYLAIENTADSFQSILTKNCVKIEDNVWYGYEIDSANVPVTFDEKSIKVAYKKPNKFTCFMVDGQPQGFFRVPLSDGSTIYIYNKASQELGHGGLPYIGPLRVPLKNEGEISYSITVNGGGEGPAIIGMMPLVIRGEKALQMSNGKTIYATYDTVVLNGDNPDLVTLLSKYSQPFADDKTAKVLTDLPEQELKNTFFKDLSNPGPEEKVAMDKINKILNGISTK